MSGADTGRAVATCAVIGAGLGGVALVARLGRQGLRVRLHDLDDARLVKIRERGGLDVEGLGMDGLHVANMIGNVGRLEGSGHGYRFYAEGYTPSLIALLKSLDAERLAVARAFGVEVPAVHEWLLRTYDLGGDSLAETFHRLTHQPTGPYQWTPTPRSLDHKYVTEDVPCGLVAMSSLGAAAGVPTPVIDGLIALASAMLGRDFRDEGRNLRRLGLAGKTVREIRAIVESGLSA